MPRVLSAIVNCRVSSTEQLDNNSLERQRDAVLRAANDLEAEIPEDGWWSGSVSSKRGTNIYRKDLHEMIEYCKKNKHVKFLIVDEPDRFMRSIDEAAYFEVTFRQLGVTVWYASDPELNKGDLASKLLKFTKYLSAEGSNEERQNKSISGQTKALKEGRYTFSPKPGYKRGYERGIQEVHEVRGPALRKVLIKLASHMVTPTQALIELNKSEFVKDGHAPYKMDKFRTIVADPFYAGIVEIDKQVKVRNENGLHEALITKDQHYELVKIINAKKKNQAGPRKNGNPKYPGNNIVFCDLCKEKRYGKYVGFDHGNGQNPKLVYEKYRCRACNRYMSRKEMHDGIAMCLKRKPTKAGIDDLMRALNVVWKDKEGQAVQDKTRIKHRIRSIEISIANQVEAATDPENASIKRNIMELIEKKKKEVKDLENELSQLESIADRDKENFLRFAFDFIQDTSSHFLDPGLSQENRLRCKQVIFPAGFWVDAQENVYTPEISPLYRLATKKKDAEASDNSHLVRVRRLKLLASSLARKRSIN